MYLSEIVEEEAGESERKLVMQLKMQTFASLRMLFNVCGKTADFVQIRTWADDIKGRSRVFVGFMWVRTFESPMMEKTREIDILKIRLILDNDRSNNVVF
jgi:hypothetical protein